MSDMRALSTFFVALLVSLAACGSVRASSSDEVLMDEIERLVVLPKGARPLGAYGRNYAFSDGGKVKAIYLVLLPYPNLNEGCEVALKNFTSRPCTRKEIAEVAAESNRAVAAETPAGKRRWFDKPDDLPYLLDGGCMQVTVEFDLATRRIILVACNGRG